MSGFNRREAHVPDATFRRADAGYIRKLIEDAGLSQRKAAAKLGISDRLMRHYAADQRQMPYALQFCLEVLARDGIAEKQAREREGIDRPESWAVSTPRDRGA